jgi:hypothetical protein
LSNLVSYVLFSTRPTSRAKARWRNKQHGCVRILEIAADGVKSVTHAVVVATSAINLIEELEGVATERRIISILFGSFAQKLVDERQTVRIV